MQIMMKAVKMLVGVAVVCLAAGFEPLAEEWWHFTLKDEPCPDRYFDFPVRSLTAR